MQPLAKQPDGRRASSRHRPSSAWQVTEKSTACAVAATLGRDTFGLFNRSMAPKAATTRFSGEWRHKAAATRFFISIN